MYSDVRTHKKFCYFDKVFIVDKGIGRLRNGIGLTSVYFLYVNHVQTYQSQCNEGSYLVCMFRFVIFDILTVLSICL